jgi:hypothetical protein
MTKQSAQEFGFMSSPPSWYEVAKQLHEQATVLFENKRSMIYVTDSNGKQTARSTANRGLFLLTGFATENMIKAFLIYEYPAFVKDGRLANKIKNHKLGKLWELSSHVPYKKRFSSVAETLSDGLETWARYPCGLFHEQEIRELAMTPELWDAYNKMFNACSVRLEKLLTAGWQNCAGEKMRMRYQSM